MIFLAVVPLGVGGFGSYLVPLMLGTRDMAFPRLGAFGYWTYDAAGVVMLSSFLVTGGAANNGWTSYAPLSVLSASSGQTFWLSIAGCTMAALPTLTASPFSTGTWFRAGQPGRWDCFSSCSSST